jgi:polyketide biosynthesis enoyl-CoA hydratase PksI
MPCRIKISADHDGIFELKIDDPENQNRLGGELCDELKATLAELASEQALKVLVMTGAKDVFCAGATIEILHKLASGTTLEDLSIPMQMLSFPVPVLAAMEGHAAGGGLALAVCCDILIAAEGARYGFNFTSMGFTPGMGTTTLVPSLVGTSFATEMLLTAKFYKGRELKGRGLFNHVVPADQVRDLAWDIARSMADKPRPVLEMVKDTLAGPRRAALHTAFSRECLMHKISFNQPEIWSVINGNYLSKS